MTWGQRRGFETDRETLTSNKRKLARLNDVTNTRSQPKSGEGQAGEGDSPRASPDSFPPNLQKIPAAPARGVDGWRRGRAQYDRTAGEMNWQTAPFASAGRAEEGCPAHFLRELPVGASRAAGTNGNTASVSFWEEEGQWAQSRRLGLVSYAAPSEPPVQEVRPPNNPRFAASDGAFAAPLPTGGLTPVTGGLTPCDRRSDPLYGRSDSLSRSSDEEIPATAQSSASRVLTRKGKNLVFITDLFHPSPMGSKVDQDDMPSNIEDLDEEGRQKYLVALAHLQNEFLKGFKKDHDTVTRVQEFVMPSFKMSCDKIDVIDTSASTSGQTASAGQTACTAGHIPSAAAVWACSTQAVRSAGRLDRLQQAVRPAYTMVTACTAGQIG
nr:unnamed protein product [Digitaria exilis]